MHGLLATTALHLLRMQPNRAPELLSTAAAHEAQALPYYRRATTALDPANVHTVFIFAAFVVAYASALPSPAPDEFETPPRWMLLLRSSLTLLSNVWPWLSGDMAPYHSQPAIPKDYEHNSEDVKLSSLRHLIDTPYASNPDEPHDIEVYHQTISALRWSSGLMSAPGTTLCLQAAAYVWPRVVPSRYLELLKAKRPKALVLLAYYCVQLHRAEFSWYFHRQARSMLEAIQAALPVEMNDWVEWPLSEVLFGGAQRVYGANSCEHGHDHLPGPQGHGESQCTDFLLFYSPTWEYEGEGVVPTSMGVNDGQVAVGGAGPGRHSQ